MAAKVNLQALNAEALAGDFDAATVLADNSPGCVTFTDFLYRYVPDEEVGQKLPFWEDRKDGRTCVFDVFYDAFRASRARAKRETAELPAVTKTKEKA